MSQQTQARLRAAILFLAPLALVVGFAYHPYVGNFIDSTEVAEAVNDDPDRWGASMVVIVLAFAAVLVAFIALRHELRTRADERWSVFAVPLAIFGAATMAAGLGMDLSLTAVANAGGDVEAVIDRQEAWANVVYGVGALAFTLGLLGLALAAYRGKVLGGQLDNIVALAFLVVAIGNFVPHTIAEYVIVVVLCVAIWPFAYRAIGETSVRAAPSPGMAST